MPIGEQVFRQVKTNTGWQTMIPMFVNEILIPNQYDREILIPGRRSQSNRGRKTTKENPTRSAHQTHIITTRNDHAAIDLWFIIQFTALSSPS